MKKPGSVNWPAAFVPLLKKYGDRAHPLDYRNLYQLVVMVVLSAQDSDKNINNLAGNLFAAFPDMRSLRGASPDQLLPFVSKVRGHRKKIDWLLRIANEIGDDSRIPLTMDELVKLPGIGRKSANVIMREAGVPAAGVIVDLHVVRVAPRIGITKSEDPKKIEADLMEVLPADMWGNSGMALSFLGREVCRPSHPEHEHCVMQSVCAYYKKFGGKAAKPVKAAARKKQGKKKTG